MIITKFVEVQISNNGAYYRALGYGLCKQGDIIQARIEDIPKNSNKDIQCLCDECKCIFSRSFQMIHF